MPSIIIRPLLTDAEQDDYYYLASATFGALENTAQVAKRWRQRVETSPQYDPCQVRGAFRGDEMLGGYICYERTLAIGSAHLLTGCIGAVATAPPHRLQGVGRTMLTDAIAFASERRHALLFLDGIPNFYHRFGFVNVMENSSYSIQLTDILALPPSPDRVRPAEAADAGDLLRLYHQEFDPFPGVFARTPAIQQHQLAGRLPANPPVLAIDARGQTKGYLLLPWSQTEPSSHEVVAADWNAASALLQHHAQLLTANVPPSATLTWQAPPGSATFLALADHIHLESATRHLPIGDWMARIGHLPTFMHAILPHWRERRQRSNLLWEGPILLDLGETTFCLDFDGPDLRLNEHPCPEATRVRLTPQALVQLAFGFRPAWWLARRPGNDIPAHLIDPLQTLAPAHPGWVPGSDRF